MIQEGAFLTRNLQACQGVLPIRGMYIAGTPSFPKEKEGIVVSSIV